MKVPAYILTIAVMIAFTPEITKFHIIGWSIATVIIIAMEFLGHYPKMTRLRAFIRGDKKVKSSIIIVKR